MKTSAAAEQLTPLQEEANFLKFLKDNFTTNAKNLQKLAAKEGMKHSDTIKQGIVHSILRSRDPVGYVRECFKQAYDYPIIIEQLIADGDHGMIVVDGVVYGVTINAQSNWLKEGDRWNIDEEIDIQHELVEGWMKANKCTVFKGKIALFPFFGFSGLFRRINKQRIFGKFV